MSRIRYTRTEILETVGPLTSARLEAYLASDCVTPQPGEDGPAFTPADVARLELLCELGDDLELDAEGLAVVMSLLDQMHGLRRQLRLLLKAIAEEPEDVRARLSHAVRAMDGG